ncbi:hypothetical protein ISN44_As05g061220 [Arabidopsis suecica]|uniref:Uncharacterized protein n=1 Tax=Arabidopsis suecica TaxID=45249 RepID=A0A8T2DRV5_ARASU|nr:hypothetical protein ISN44_As05g061220 [Arabidopsis suecica]
MKSVRLTSPTELDIGEFGGYFDLDFGAQFRERKRLHLEESKLVKGFSSPTIQETSFSLLITFLTEITN